MCGISQNRGNLHRLASRFAARASDPGGFRLREVAVGIQALILAAGRGHRLGPNLSGIPKPLLEVGRRPLVEHMLQTLSDAGVGPVGMVVGYCADEIKEVVGIRAEYIHNLRWASTNSLYSFSLAREWVKGPVMVLNCDLLVHPEIVDRVLAAGEDCLAYDSSSGDGREQMAVQFRDGILTDMSKELTRARADGENVGVLYLSQETARVVLDEADDLLKRGREKDWLGSAVCRVAKTRRIRGVDVTGLPWAEIDFANDLEHARKAVWPAIQGKSLKRAIRWRVARWAIAAGIALAFSPLLISAWLSPSAPDWDTMDLTGGEAIKISKKDRLQRWWHVDDESVLSTEVVGPDTIRIESRLVMYGPEEEYAPYVVEIRLDGERHDWYKLDARPSKSAAYQDWIIGKRKRIEFEVPEGKHRVSVALIAADEYRCLVRFRQQDPDDE